MDRRNRFRNILSQHCYIELFISLASESSSYSFDVPCCAAPHEGSRAGYTHSETPPGENQNLFARLTVRTYVWIVPDWTLQQSMAKSTERQVQQVAYQGKL